MAETVATLRVMCDPRAAIEATEFLHKYEERIKHDEPLWERLQDLMDHNQMFILVPTPEKKLHFSIEPSYPMLEIMAELAR